MYLITTRATHQRLLNIRPYVTKFFAGDIERGIS